VILDRLVPLFFAVATATATAPASTIPSIDALCEPLARYARAKQNVPQIFADVSEQHDKGETPQWRVFQSKAELDRRATKDGLYTQAFVWKQKAGTFVLMYLTSPSGDWAEYADYCYRPDDSLARSVSTLNTFDVATEAADPVSRVRTRHFDPDGRLLRTRARVVDINTRKPTKVAFADQDDAVFKTLRELPFAGLAVAARRDANKVTMTKEQNQARRAELRREFGSLYDFLLALLFEADPIGINFETNDDEYEPEVMTILPRLKEASGVKDLQRTVHEEFVRWFGAESAGPAAKYGEIARRLQAELDRRKRH
jgi:hypothetical protein